LREIETTYLEPSRVTDGSAVSGDKRFENIGGDWFKPIPLDFQRNIIGGCACSAVKPLLKFTSNRAGNKNKQLGSPVLHTQKLGKQNASSP
jgi:hypothetical protein